MFTADLHFGHANIIRFCNRPFSSIEEMNEGLIDNWNASVAPGQDIYCLGDFMFGNARDAGKYLDRLNGRKHLVWGNHDSKKVQALPQWASSQPYLEIAVNSRKIVLFHYSLRVWSASRYGAIHLYGHSHGNLPGAGNSTDVGVDCWNMRPVGLADILARIADKPRGATTASGDAANKTQDD